MKTLFLSLVLFCLTSVAFANTPLKDKTKEVKAVVENMIVDANTTINLEKPKCRVTCSSTRMGITFETSAGSVFRGCTKAAALCVAKLDGLF